MSRVFLAADLDGEFLDAAHSRAAALAEGLRGGGRSKVRAVVRDAMHITLRFFGDATEEQIDALRALVGELGAGAASPVVRGVSVTGFPRSSHARVVVLEIEDDGSLRSLAERAEAMAVALGFAPSERPFRAHLTLGRLREAADVRSIAGAAPSMPAGRVTAITLYSSALLPTGPVYTSLARAVLE